MADLINFDATEFGGTGTLKMQGSLDGGNTWVDASPYVTLTNGQIDVTDTNNLAIDVTIFLPGNTYLFRLIDQDGITTSNTLTVTIPATGITTWSGSGSGSGSGSDTAGIGNANLSTVEFLGISNDGSGNCLVAYDAVITIAGMGLWLVDTTSGDAIDISPMNDLLTVGSVFMPSGAGAIPFVEGHVYNLVLIDPIGILAQIYSNTVTAANNVINSITNNAGNVTANITVDPVVAFAIALVKYDANGNYIFGASVDVPLGTNPGDADFAQPYTSGDYVQLYAPQSLPNLIASAFIQLP